LAEFPGADTLVRDEPWRERFNPSRRDFNTAYTEQFNLMVQKEIGRNVITLGTIGELGRKCTFCSTTGNLPLTDRPYAKTPPRDRLRGRR